MALPFGLYQAASQRQRWHLIGGFANLTVPVRRFGRGSMCDDGGIGSQIKSVPKSYAEARVAGLVE